MRVILGLYKGYVKGYICEFPVVKAEELQSSEGTAIA